MSWKTTLATGILCAVFAGYYLFTSGSANGPDVPPVTKVIPYPIDQYARIDITRPGNPEVVLVQQLDPITKLRWRVSKPIDRLANEGMVLDICQALDALRCSGGIRKGDPRHTPPSLGLESPSILVTVTNGVKPVTVKFGKKSAIDPALRYFMVEGDETIYLCPGSIAEAFEKSLYDIRNKGLAKFEPVRANEIELTTQFLVVRQVRDKDGNLVIDRVVWQCPRCGHESDKAGTCGRDKAAYVERKIPKAEQRMETDVCRIKLREGEGRGWYLTERNGQNTLERLDDARVVQAITNLSNAWCDTFIEKADLKTYKLDNPNLKYRVWLNGIDAPVEVSFAHAEEKLEKGGTRQVVAALVAGTSEIGLMDIKLGGAFYRHLNDLRMRQAFDFTREQIRKIAIATQIGEQKLGVEIVNESAGRPGMPVWGVKAPKGFMALPPEDIDRNVIEKILSLEIKDWIPMQSDLTIFGLGTPPDLLLTITVERTKDKPETLELRFGNRESEDAYLLRPLGTEICVVPADFVKTLDRGELLVKSKEMFTCPRKDLVEISVEFKEKAPYAAVFYRLVKNEKGDWEFGSANNKGMPVDPEKLNMILGIANYIEAEAYITRRSEFGKSYGLLSQTPPGRLFIKYRLPDSSLREVALHISEPQTGSAGGELYYAKFNPIQERDLSTDLFFQTIFRVKRQIIDLMRKAPIKEKAPDEGTEKDKPKDEHKHEHDERDKKDKHD